jgi:hypothetical protein
MKPKLEELRKKAFILYGGREGVEKVGNEIRKFGIPEDQLNDYQLKIVLNNIIKHVFIDKAGLEEAKKVLSMKVTHVPGYQPFIEIDESKIRITSKINFMKTLVRVIVVLAVVVAAVFWFYIKSFDPLEVCDRKETLEVREMCYKNLAITSKNHTICDKLSGRMDVLNCYYKIAVNTKEYTICDKIPTDTPEQYSIYSKCFTCMANLNRNETLCSKIKDLFEQQQCRDKVRSDMSIACV